MGIGIHKIPTHGSQACRHLEIASRLAHGEEYIERDICATTPRGHASAGRKMGRGDTKSQEFEQGRRGFRAAQSASAIPIADCDASMQAPVRACGAEQPGQHGDSRVSREWDDAYITRHRAVRILVYREHGRCCCYCLSPKYDHGGPRAWSLFGGFVGGTGGRRGGAHKVWLTMAQAREYLQSTGNR